MKKKNSILNLSAILIIFNSFFVLAEEVKKDKEEIYFVQPGDTLWEISGKFYYQPQEWKKIYSANPEIINPDLIQPGIRLIIPLEKTLEMIVSTETIIPIMEDKMAEKKEEKTEETLEISTIVPQIIIEKEEKKEIIIPEKKSWKMRFSPGSFLVSEQWQFDGLITEEKNKKMLISTDDTVYLNIGSRKGMKPGMYCLVGRKGEKIYDSQNLEFKGRNIQRLGLVEIIEVQENTSSAKVLTSSEAIGAGDGVKIILEE